MIRGSFSYWGVRITVGLLLIWVGFGVVDGLGLKRLPEPPVADAPRPDVIRYIDADATTLDIYNVQCEQLLHATLVGTDGIAVRWEDGPETCAPIGGMDILVGDEVFRLWWCSLPNGVQFDWRNVERGDCGE